MIELVSCILCSSLIFVVFKLFPRYKIDTFQAIVFNYFTAASCGIIFFHSEFKGITANDVDILKYAFYCAILFISLFLIMGISSQRNGVSSTSVAVKMSMSISMLAMIYYNHESLSILKISGLIAAILGVILVSLPSKSTSNGKQAIWMLFVLFFGSGLLDFLLNVFQKSKLSGWHPGLFSALGFLMAGIMGIGIIGIQLLRKKMKIELKNIFAGIVLGVPNYFSIYLLLAAYQTTGWSDSTVLAIINVSVVLTASIIGLSLFSEKLNLKKTIGLCFSILAIIILYISNAR